MALKTGGGLRKVSWVITQSQHDRIQEIFKQRRKPYNRISQSEIVRELLEAGLDVFPHEKNIAFIASEKSGDSDKRKSA